MTDNDEWAENDGASEDAPTAGTSLYFASVDEFVREFICPTYTRQVGGGTPTRLWAGEWWRHREAVARLEALWRAWEHLRMEGSTGVSVWFRDHADHHMNILMNPEGPFAAIDIDDPTNKNKKGEPLPYVAPPEGLFPNVRDA